MRAKTQVGQSMVEFAIMLPLMVLLLVGIIQFGIIVAHYLALNHAAVVGARTASVAPAATADADGEAAALKAAQSFIKNTAGLTPLVSPATVGSQQAMECKCTFNLNLIFPNFFKNKPLSMSATAVMRREGGVPSP